MSLSKVIKEPEKFEVEHCESESIFLKSHMGKYLTVDKNGDVRASGEVGLKWGKKFVDTVPYDLYSKWDELVTDATLTLQIRQEQLPPTRLPFKLWPRTKPTAWGSTVRGQEYLQFLRFLCRRTVLSPCVATVASWPLKQTAASVPIERW